MSTTVHTDIALGAAANAAIVNAPLGQLDQAISNIIPYDATQAPWNVKTDGTDQSANMQAWLTAIPAGGRGLLPTGTVTCKTATGGVVLQLLNKASITIEGSGRGSIIRFQDVTAVDGFRIDGCTNGTFRDFQVQVAGTAIVTNALQYTCGSPGSTEQGAFERVFVTNQNQVGRWAQEVLTISGSAVITSAQAAFAAGDVGGWVGLKMRAPTPVLSTTILSVATLTGTTTAAALTNSQTNIPMLAAIAGAPAGTYTVKIDAEIMLVTSGGQTATLTVTRGYAGTTAATHLASATVTTYQATLNANATFSNNGNPFPGLAWIYIQTPTSAVMKNGVAVGTDHPGAGNMDVSGTNFTECTSTGALEANWRLGNGTVGNVLNVTFTGCLSNVGATAVLANGCNFSWHNGWVGETGTDFLIGSTAGGPISIEGVRGENSGQLLDTVHGQSTVYSPIGIRDVQVNAFKAADGIPIRYTANGGLTLENVTLLRSLVGGAVTIYAAGNNAVRTDYVAINVVTDGSGNPHPVASSLIRRTITGGVLADPVTAAALANSNTWGTIVDDIFNPTALAYSVDTTLAGAIAPSLGAAQYYDPPALTASQTVATPLSPKIGEELIYEWTQDATGGRVITYPANFKISGTGAFSTVASTVTIDRFLYDGSFWRITSRMTGMTL